MEYTIVICYDQNGDIKAKQIYSSSSEGMQAQKDIAEASNTRHVIVAYTAYTDGLNLTKEQTLNQFVEHINDGACDFKWRCEKTIRGTNRHATERVQTIEDLAHSLTRANKKTGDLKGALNDALAKIDSSLRVS